MTLSSGSHSPRDRLRPSEWETGVVPPLRLLDEGPLACTYTGVTAGWACVALSGEADEASRTSLKVALLRVLADWSSKIAVDVCALRLLDSAGLTALLVVHQRAVARKGGLCLIGPSRPVRMLLALSHVDRILPVHDDLEALLGCPGCIDHLATDEDPVDPRS